MREVTEADREWAMGRLLQMAGHLSLDQIDILTELVWYYIAAVEVRDVETRKFWMTKMLDLVGWLGRPRNDPDGEQRIVWLGEEKTPAEAARGQGIESL
jgi:hypothetical protein